MCVCCRTRQNQGEMLRLRAVNGEIAKWCGSGRSFYICKDCAPQEKSLRKICKILRLSEERVLNHLKELISQWQKNNYQRLK